MLVARIASRAASACRACRRSACAALTARHLSDAAAKQHERALEALDAGAPPEAVVPLFEAAAAEGHAEATFFVGLAKAGLLEPDDGTVGGSPPEVDLEGAAAPTRRPPSWAARRRRSATRTALRRATACRATRSGPTTTTSRRLSWATRAPPSSSGWPRTRSTVT